MMYARIGRIINTKQTKQITQSRQTNLHATTQRRTKFSIQSDEFLDNDRFKPDDKFNYKSWFIKKDIEREEKKRLGIEEKEEERMDARKLLAKMHKAYAKPNENLYNRMIKSFVNSHNCRGALYVIDDMKKHNLIPSVESYTVLINALYQNNIDFNGAHYISKEFQKYYPDVPIPHPFGEENPHPVDVMDYYAMKGETAVGVAEKFIEERIARDKERFAKLSSTPLNH